jgi:hypothetical protein
MLYQSPNEDFSASSEDSEQKEAKRKFRRKERKARKQADKNAVCAQGVKEEYADKSSRAKRHEKEEEKDDNIVLSKKKKKIRSNKAEDENDDKHSQAPRASAPALTTPKQEEIVEKEKKLKKVSKEESKEVSGESDFTYESYSPEEPPDNLAPLRVRPQAGICPHSPSPRREAQPRNNNPGNKATPHNPKATVSPERSRSPTKKLKIKKTASPQNPKTTVSPERSRSPTKKKKKSTKESNQQRSERANIPKPRRRTERNATIRERTHAKSPPSDAARSSDRDFATAPSSSHRPRYTFADRDAAQGFIFGKSATCQRGHYATVSYLRKVHLCTVHRVNVSAQCERALTVSNIVTVCHDCNPTFVACIECTCELITSANED